MIQCFAGSQFPIRYFLVFFSLCLTGIIVSYNFFVPNFAGDSGLFGLTFVLYLFAVAVLIYLWFLRYPPSGRKYFKKAIRLDPKCSDAYMYLGLIALRRYQKRKACQLLEQAVRLNANSKSKIEQKLTSLYEKEFIAFFNKTSEKEIRLPEIIDHQLNQIRQLRSKNANLDRFILKPKLQFLLIHRLCESSNPF